MAESGAGNSIAEILQNWSNVANLFVAFIIAGLVPVLKYGIRKYTKWKDARDAAEAAKEKAAIVEIAKEVQQPVTTRIDKMEEILSTQTKQNAIILDHMNIIEQLLQNGRVSFEPNRPPPPPPNKRGPGRPSKHYDHSIGDGDHSGYHPR